MHGPVLVWDMLVVSQRRMAASWRYSHDMWRVRLSYSPVGANSSAGRLHGAQRLWKGSPPSEEPFHSRMRLITVVPGILRVLPLRSRVRLVSSCTSRARLQRTEQNEAHVVVRCSLSRLTFMHCCTAEWAASEVLLGLSPTDRKL